MFQQLASIFFVCLSIASFAETKLSDIPPFPLKQHTLIEILKYDRQTETFAIGLVNASGQGPFFATPEELSKGVKSLKLKTLRSNPEDVVKQQFSTDEEMKLITADVAKKRAKKKK